MASAAAAAASSSRLPADPPQGDSKDTKPAANNETNNNETNNQEDGLEDEQEITYNKYQPKKLSFGRPHPDPVVENSTLGSVEPPDITYNLVMPADIISEGKLSNLQLEAIVYGCQRHMVDLPRAPSSNTVGTAGDGRSASAKENVVPVKSDGEDGIKPGGGGSDVPQDDVKMNMDVPLDVMEERQQQQVEPPATRAGFLLGDGAGMGKGRTLAGFVVENIARGRKKHIWISVSGDLYEDAKRDLSDLGLADYAEKNCFNLGKLPYGSLVSASSSTKSKKKAKKGKKSKSKQPTGNYDEGVMFSTYSALIGKKTSTGETRLEQLIEWCGEDFDGLIMLDECHKVWLILQLLLSYFLLGPLVHTFCCIFIISRPRQSN